MAPTRRAGAGTQHDIHVWWATSMVTGRADLVGVAEESVVVALSTGQAFAAHNVWSLDFVYAFGWRVEQHPRFVAELDGDGKLDLVGFGDDGVWAALSTGRSFAASARWIAQFGHDDDVGGWRADRHARLVVDVDGDHRADVVGIAEKDLQVSFSTGASFALPKTLGPTPLAIGGGWDPASEPVEVGDVDGNGMGDLIGFGRSGVQVALSMRTTFMAPTLWLSDFGASTGWTSRAPPHARRHRRRRQRRRGGHGRLRYARSALYRPHVWRSAAVHPGALR